MGNVGLVRSKSERIWGEGKRNSVEEGEDMGHGRGGSGKKNIRAEKVDPGH